jgi:hypothetical protein
MAAAADPRFFDFKAAAAYTSLGERTLRKLAAAGRLRVYHPVPGRAVLDRLELDSLVLESAAQTSRAS